MSMEHTKDTKKPLLDEEKMEYDGGDEDITCKDIVGKKWFKISMAVAVLLVGVVVISVFMRGGESAAAVAGTTEGDILS